MKPRRKRLEMGNVRLEKCEFDRFSAMLTILLSRKPNREKKKSFPENQNSKNVLAHKFKAFCF